MYKQIIALTLLALATVSYAQVVGWVDCGSTANIVSLRAGPCTSVPCPFRRGETYDIILDAVATAPSSQLPYTVSAMILGLPWTIMQGNACEQLTCPTTPGTPFQFSYRYTVTPEFPPVPAIVNTTVLNQNGATVICFTLPIQIN